MIGVAVRRGLRWHTAAEYYPTDCAAGGWTEGEGDTAARGTFPMGAPAFTHLGVTPGLLTSRTFARGHRPARGVNAGAVDQPYIRPSIAPPGAEAPGYGCKAPW